MKMVMNCEINTVLLMADPAYQTVCCAVRFWGVLRFAFRDIWGFWRFSFRNAPVPV